MYKRQIGRFPATVGLQHAVTDADRGSSAVPSTPVHPLLENPLIQHRLQGCVDIELTHWDNASKSNTAIIGRFPATVGLQLAVTDADRGSSAVPSTPVHPLLVNPLIQHRLQGCVDIELSLIHI